MGSPLGGDLSESVVRWCLRHGVREAVLCAGARNLALVAAFLRAPQVRSWNHPEERSGAFFALGRTRVTGGPVAVVVTSGTAVAEMLPAVIEAWHQDLPLLAVTADRPRGWRGRGAPQSMVQPGIFGPHAELLADAEGVEALRAVTWNRHRPGQLNVCLPEPGEEAACGGEITEEEIHPPAPRPVVGRQEFGEQGSLLVTVGRLAPEERGPVRRFLLARGAAAAIEGESGLWGDPGLAGLWVRDPGPALAAGAFTHVLSLGGVPCGRYWRDLEEMEDVQVLRCSRDGMPGLGRTHGVTSLMTDLSGWEEPVDKLGKDGEQAGDKAGSIEHKKCVKTHDEPLNYGGLYRDLASTMPKDARLFLGNSSPVRDWHELAPWKPLPNIYANRGVNGIDGEVSTFFAVAEGAPEAWAIVGDLTALYDMVAPWVLPQMHTRRLRLVVVNNRGGRLFDRLAGVRTAPENVRNAITNPHILDFRHLAAFWAMAYRRVERAGQLQELPDEPVLVEWVAGGSRER